LEFLSLLRTFAQACKPDDCHLDRSGEMMADEKLGGVAPSTVRLAVTETLVQEIPKSAAGVHGPLSSLNPF
jgi:hypothetical protein